MDAQMTREEFSQNIIAQADSGGYDPSGYICVKISDDLYGISSFGHCSCYGTWTALGGHQGLGFAWTGSKDRLVQLATLKEDFAMPGRKINDSDYDYGYLVEVYQQIIETLGGPVSPV